MASAQLELAVARLLARGRLLERAIYRPRAWTAILSGEERFQVPLAVEVLSDRVAFSGYYDGPAREFDSIEVWQDSDMLYSCPLGTVRGPSLRISFSIGLLDTERAA